MGLQHSTQIGTSPGRFCSCRSVWDVSYARCDMDALLIVMVFIILLDCDCLQAACPDVQEQVFVELQQAGLAASGTTTA